MVGVKTYSLACRMKYWEKDNEENPAVQIHRYSRQKLLHIKEDTENKAPDKE